MPIGAINVNTGTNTLALRGAGPKRGTSGYFSFRIQGTKVWVDDSPIVDESTRPWGITEVNEVNVGSLTGNLTDEEKKALMVHWFQQHVFDTIILISSLPADDPDKTVDPDNSKMFWCDEDGVKNPSGLFMNSRANILVDFDDTALLSGEFNATIRKA